MAGFDPEKVLADGAESLLGIELSAEQLAMFRLYREELALWNEKVNLTAIVDPVEVAIKHFLDSLTPVNLIVQAGPDNPSLVDLGSGAGFPGIPLKILRPEIRVTLVESRRKKVSFMRYLLGLLEIDAQVVHARAEDAGGSYDFAVSRALTEPGEFISIARNLLTERGRIIMMLGKRELGRDIPGRHGLIEEAGASFELPLNMGERKVVLLRRSEETDG